MNNAVLCKFWGKHFWDCVCLVLISPLTGLHNASLSVSINPEKLGLSVRKTHRAAQRLEDWMEIEHF